MGFLSNSQFVIIIQLLLSALLGGLVGFEREYKRKEAGLRTYTLVSLGAALFTIVSIKSFDYFAGRPGVNFDPGRIIGQIVLGVGFLGAGLIVFKDFHIEGLTSAAGLWMVAGIGSAVGSGLYFVAVFVTFLTIGILAGLRIIEEKVFHKDGMDSQKKS